jgi:hypothetical protein
MSKPNKELIKLYLQALLDEMKKKVCLRLDGAPRAAFDSFEEAEAFSLTHENYVGDVPYNCMQCKRVHLARPAWLLPNRVAEIRRGDEILSSPVGDQDSCIAWIRQTLRPDLGDEILHIRSRESGDPHKPTSQRMLVNELGTQTRRLPADEEDEHSLSQYDREFLKQVGVKIKF